MPDTEVLESFGLTLDEHQRAFAAAHEHLGHIKSKTARKQLADDAPAIAQGSRDRLAAAWRKLLSGAGRALLVNFFADETMRLNTFDGFVECLLADPFMVRDLSIWALFFACRDASDGLQLDDCRAPSSESHLSGQLLGGLAAGCERWRKVVSAALERYDSALALSKIDLSILGGEQATGGDFGLILDIDGASIQPAERDSRERRIVPMILQAKRYVRPNADISQRHWERGYQRHMLARNDCASAYILYENGTETLTRTLPPLVKPVEAVDDANQTAATIGGFEFASYVVTCLLDPGLAPGADTPDDALRMIYARGRPNHIALVSGDPRVTAHYQAQFDALARELRDDRGEELVPITT